MGNVNFMRFYDESLHALKKVKLKQTPHKIQQYYRLFFSKQKFKKM